MNEEMIWAYQVAGVVQNGVPAIFLLALGLFFWAKVTKPTSLDTFSPGLLGLGAMGWGAYFTVNTLIWALAPLYKLVPIMVKVLEKRAL